MAKRRLENIGQLTLHPRTVALCDKAVETGLFGNTRIEFVRNAVYEKLQDLTRAGIIFLNRETEEDGKSNL